MGQRCVISIERNEKPLAKIYYHWSGYTADALYKTRDIIRCIYNHKNETDREMLLRLIHFCEKNGGGIDAGDKGEEWKYITTTYPGEKFKSEGISRNDGLIAISPNGMTEMQRYSEGDVYINLDEDNVDFCVYCGYESLSEYVEERKSWDDDFEEFTLEELPYIDYDLGYFDISEIDGLIEAFEATEDNQNVIRFKSEIVELI
jgi:hypothetical protein